MSDEDDRVPMLILDDKNGPIVMPDLEAPFMIYPLKNSPGFVVQGIVRVAQGSKPMAFQVPMTFDDAIELAQALVAYLHSIGMGEGLPEARGQLLPRQ